MIIKTAEFIKSATSPSEYPPPDVPEVAFAGRSNVGKSSLINTLVNRKHLVKTSATPGKTRLINFFLINKAFSFIDLPGYGYAKVPHEVRKKWGVMIETYMTSRSTLKGVVLIMDIRRTPASEEISLINWLKTYSIPGIFVLSKADKLSKIKQMNQKNHIVKSIFVKESDVIMFSTKTRQGLNEVWDAIKNLIGEKA